MFNIIQPPPEDSVMQSEVDFFDVELAKGTQGLGITIAGYVGEKTSGIAKLKMCRMKTLYQRLYVKYKTIKTVPLHSI